MQRKIIFKNRRPSSGIEKEASGKERNFFDAVMTDPFFAPLGKGAVQLHTESALAPALTAKAVSLDNEIFFGPRQWAPESAVGQRLLAHELAHVVQHRNQPGKPAIARRQISTPLPSEAVVDERSRQAKFSIGAVAVVVEPDQTLRRGTRISWRGGRDQVAPTGAVTLYRMTMSAHPVVSGKGAAARITDTGIRFTLFIKTFYGRSAAADRPSAYGRGTTAADIAAGNTSLGFHEGQHGQDFQDYIRNHPLPVLDLQYPATRAAYRAAFATFQSDFNEYSQQLVHYSEQQTDQVGIHQHP